MKASKRAALPQWPSPSADLVCYVNETNLRLLNLTKQLLSLSLELIKTAPLSPDERRVVDRVLAGAASDADQLASGLEALRREIARYRPN